MLDKIKKHALKWALILSLLLHVIAFVLLGLTLDFLPLFPAALAQPQAKSEPIVFTLADTPESARLAEPSPEAKYASDKNAQAQNPDAPQDLPIGEAYSEGAFAEADMPPQLKSSGVGRQPALVVAPVPGRAARRTSGRSG
jgi:hypothetical protein